MGTSKRMVIYTRISQDRSGEGLGVDRQREACERLAEARDWEIAAYYTDNDLSASTFATKDRPGYERLKADSALYDGIIVWALDRLLRSTRQAAEILDLGKPIYTVQQGDLDLSTSMGRQFARLLASFAEEESLIKSERIRAKRAQEATQGKWSGQRSFGFNPDGSIINEEAEMIREAVKALLNGESLMSVTRLMNTRTTTIRGNKWNPVTVRQLLTRAALSGQREHTSHEDRRKYRMWGEIVGPGQWEAIITPEQTAAIRLIFENRQRPKGVKRFYLSGKVVCSKCGNAMHRRKTMSGKHPDRYRWQCTKAEGTTKCGRVSIVAYIVEEETRSHMIDILDHKIFTPNTKKPTTYDTTDAEERRRVLAKEFGRGTITADDFRSGIEEIQRQIDMNIQATTLYPWGRFGAIVQSLEGDTGQEKWDNASDDQKRTLVDHALFQIRIRPAKKKGSAGLTREQLAARIGFVHNPLDEQLVDTHTMERA